MRGRGMVIVRSIAKKLSMDWVQVLGLVAGCFTSTSTFPQIIKTWKTKDATDISVGMFSVLLAGVILWTFYGVKKNDLPIIVTNALATVLNATMLFFKFRYGMKK
jgi:MtN3 and saliva related transmembrane protein